MSHEIFNIAEAEAVGAAECNMCRTVMRGAIALPGSKTTTRREGSRWNLRHLASDRTVPVPLCREGEEPKPAMNRGKGSDLAIAAKKPLNATGRGGGGAKGGERGERGAANHIPNAESETCDPGAELSTASHKAEEAGRFIALLHHVNIDTCGWRSTRSGARPPPEWTARRGVKRPYHGRSPPLL